MDYKIRFPVGDWSDDGHGKCSYFLVKSNKPVEEVREIHFSAKDKLCFDIGAICKEYEESELSIEIIEKLKNLGFKIEWKGENEDMARYFHSVDSRLMGPEEVFNLWIDILMFLDPELKLEPVTDQFKDINFYGFDKQGRHLNTPGYGCYH